MPDPSADGEAPEFIYNDRRIMWRADPSEVELPDDSVFSRGLDISPLITGLVVPQGGIRYVGLEGAPSLSARADKPGCLMVRERVSEDVPGSLPKEVYELWGLEPGRVNLCATDSIGRSFSKLDISVKASDTKLVYFGFIRDQTRAPARSKADIQPLLNGANKIYEPQTNLSFVFQNQYQDTMFVDFDGDLGSNVNQTDAWKVGHYAATHSGSNADLFVFFIWELVLDAGEAGDLCGIHRFQGGYHVIVVDDGCPGLQSKVLAHEIGHALTVDHRDELYDATGHSGDTADLMFRSVGDNPDGIRITFEEANVMNPSGT